MFVVLTLNVTSIKAEEVDDRLPAEILTDFVFPSFGSNKKNNSDNEYLFSQLREDIGLNLKNNGKAWADFIKRDGKDYIFKPNRDIWQIIKDTYNSVRNTEWSLVANGSFSYQTVPGQNHYFNRENAGVSSFGDYRIHLNSKSFINDVTVNGSRVSELPKESASGMYGGSEFGKKYDYVVNFPSGFISQIVLRTSGVSNPIFVRGYKVGRPQEMKEIFNHVDLTNIEINNLIDIQIEKHFPGSNVDNNEQIYKFNNEFYNYYNNNNVINEDVIVNNNFITNYIGDWEDAEEIGVPVDDVDNNDILTKILQAIKDLPRKIADLLPQPVSEAGTNIWDFLTSIVDAISNIGTSLIDGILDNLTRLIEAILNIAFPNDEQIENSKIKAQGLVDDVKVKTAVFTEPMETFQGAFSSSNSLYEKTITIKEQEIHLLSPAFRPAVEAFRLVANGIVVILTFIFVYNRFRRVVT